MKECPDCDGTGLTGTWKDCPHCGQMYYDTDSDTPCPECNGTGLIDPNDRVV